MSRVIVELKRAERLFILVRWAAAPVALLLAWLHDPLSEAAMMGLAAGLAVVNATAWALNRRVRTARSQQALGVAMLVLDTLAVATAISLFVQDFYTAAYAVFALVVVEAAMRYALVGSLGMALVFAAGLAAAMLARRDFFDVRFSLSGYAFWTLFMAMLALAVGSLVREARKRQHEVERLSGEQARLQERHRLSRELHDSLLKTLHGLALEAHALRGLASRDPQAAAEKAGYMEAVCHGAGREIRALVFDLRQDQEEPLGAWAEALLKRWGERTGINVDFRWDGKPGPLPPRLAHDLRQVLEEALTNVERHACAKHVAVALSVAGSALELEVKDDGRGPAQEARTADARAGLGLMSMKERMGAWGGSLAFSRSESGARLAASVPLGSIESGDARG